MKVLFLTFSPGYGHTRAAEAIEVALRNYYPDIETESLDVTHLIDANVRAAVQDGYLRMTTEEPQLYQKLYDMDKDIYRQLAGKMPADINLVEFLAEQQQRWYPEIAEGPLFSISELYNNLDSALLNSLINGICNRTKIPVGRLLLQGLLSLIYSILATRLKNYVNQSAPDLLIATQMYPNALLSRAIQKNVITQPLIGVLTDFGAHGVWVRNTTRMYCVSHSAVAESFHQQGVAAESIHVTGIPLMPEFENPPTQARARFNLGLDNRPTILITGGQCGIGILDTVKCLVRDDRHSYQILVAAGNTLAANRELQHLVEQYPKRFKLYAWRNDMVSLLRAADVVIGKPGGLTVAESLACARPFIATCCLGGQEMHNVKFLQEKGAGFQIEVTDLPDVLHKLFNNAEELRSMKQAAELHGRRCAAKAVVAQVETIRLQNDASLIQHHAKI